MTPKARYPTSARVLGALALTLLWSCAPIPAQAPLPQLTYGHLGVLRLDARTVEIVAEYSPPLTYPNVEHLFPVSPEAALRRWAVDRLQPAGRQALGDGRRVIVLVKDARVVETRLPRTEGLRGAFTEDQSERYDAVLEVAIEIRSDRANFRDAFVTARAERSRTVTEGISISARERVWFEITESLMNDLNRELDRQMRENFRQFLL